ncbi:endonuclease [Macrococcoides caseolyticum]|uniref:NUMOD4 motif-containing HNH endonuclease n=1 Tax=Macrococcoides caseolyticum TaxID=69966 RepID=UPI000C332D91|nr:NUMOD4 motif-containing HNH endonuclease [Macrococcus caseolyticus]PKE47263.1 endonuclease [Macrococcus caseolyticus]TDM23351.1 endonuclease [Macrococcus caseolyticus]
MKEIWKPANGYEGYYEVSNKGRLRSVERKATYKDGRTFRYKSRLIKGRLDQKGYVLYGLNVGGKKSSKRIHRMVAEAFIPNPYNKETVNHIDGDKKNNRLENLEWATYSENTIKGHEIGLFKKANQMTAKRLLGNKYKAKPVVVEIKNTNERLTFDSARDASRYINRCQNYFTQLLRVGGENKEYKVFFLETLKGRKHE